MILKTARLTLVPATAEMTDWEITDPEAFGQALGASVPPNWPPEILADALPWLRGQLAANPDEVGWFHWYGLWDGDDPERPTLAASGGFLGPPLNGAVEVGYSVLPQFQGRGLATEMIGTLAAWAMMHPSVERVVAETSGDNRASQRVLEKLGFAPAGPGREPDSRRFERTGNVTMTEAAIAHKHSPQP